MTIKELYNWAHKEDAEDLEFVIRAYSDKLTSDGKDIEVFNEQDKVVLLNKNDYYNNNCYDYIPFEKYSSAIVTHYGKNIATLDEIVAYHNLVGIMEKEGTLPSKYKFTFDCDVEIDEGE